MTVDNDTIRSHSTVLHDIVLNGDLPKATSVLFNTVPSRFYRSVFHATVELLKRSNHPDYAIVEWADQLEACANDCGIRMFHIQRQWIETPMPVEVPQYVQRH